MSEEDEVDILGDFQLDKNDSLFGTDYDYGSSLQWPLDKPSTNLDCWYEGHAELLERPGENKECTNYVETENAVNDDSGWTEKEKYLLGKGIEIFGRCNVKVSQFIGSKSPDEVQYYFTNYYSQKTSINVDQTVVSYTTDIIDATQIPVSLEEVIEDFNPLIEHSNSKKKKRASESSNSNKNVILKKSSKHDALKKKTKLKKSKFKFKTNVKLPFLNQFKKNQQETKRNSGERARNEKVHITTGAGLGVPLCEGEELVKISKETSDSDTEIDVQDSSDECAPPRPREYKKTEILQPINTNLKIDDCSHGIENVEDWVSDADDRSKDKLSVDLSDLEESVVNDLTCLEQPHQEVVLQENNISELEKVIHNEFFEGRPTKTPLRYLKIRNHIINTWLMKKPSYVTKTSIRHGLKNCGDVNCISRVHCYLEQTGVINFGCEQTNYIRPLYEVFQAAVQFNKEKPLKKFKREGHNLNSMTYAMGARIKRNHLKNIDGGCTLTHDENGDVIDTTIVKNEKPAKAKKEQAVQLIYCRDFSETNPPKYTVKMHLTTLLLMDLHAHTSLTEVIGLIAGTWDSHSKVLTISHYEPCRNLASSTTHCDMCPVSQSEAAQAIHARKLRVLGWFHSHPTFVPEPSQQDLNTQSEMQLWIGSEAPCVSIILSPFSCNGALVASPFSCMVVDEDQFVPYKFKVELVSDMLDIRQFSLDINNVFSFRDDSHVKNNFSFTDKYFRDHSITHLQKYVSSAQIYLSSWGNYNKASIDLLIKNIINICTQKYK